MDHLTVKEATKLVGKSESTIKRLLREITAEADHPERHFILPTHDEVTRRKADGEPYVWKIAKALLEKRYPHEESAKEGSHSPAESTSNSGVSDAIVGVLREQLQSKDRQIETLEKQLDRKDEQIANNNERMREQNILMKELQERLAIAPPSKPADIVMDSDPQRGVDVQESQTEASRPGSIWTRQFNLFSRKRS